MEGHSCGPDGDGAFFVAMMNVFNEFPDAARKYAISCIDHETDMLKIDFSKQVEIGRLVDGKGRKGVVSVFADREGTGDPFGGELTAAGLICCRWVKTADNVWECTKRWDHAIATGEGTDDIFLKA